MPSLLCITLPHLTPDFESLYDEMEPAVQARPRAALADQYRFMFDWLRQYLNRRVWVERSGGSLLFGRRLITLFPEARVVHIYRDGRDTALSMSQHSAFKLGPVLVPRLQRLGIDLYGGDPLSNLNVLNLVKLRFGGEIRLCVPGHFRQGWLRGFKFPHLDLSLPLLCMPQVILHLLLQPALRAAAETLRQANSHLR